MCAVTRRRFPVGASPTRQPLQPEATEAVMEVTKWLKPSDSVSRIVWPISRTKWILRRFDHSAIYVTIAGTYTPFIVQMKIGVVSMGFLIGVWLVAIVGITLKLLLPGRLDRLAILLYLLLGWSGVVFYEPVAAALPSLSLWLLAAGGILYSAGVIFHVWQNLRFQNAIWHGFVLVAACCHYSAVLDCVVLARA